MSDEPGGRELTPREPDDGRADGSALTPAAEGEQRDVERFSAGPQGPHGRAHRGARRADRAPERQRAHVVFLAVLLIALFIPVYWFYENGVPALGTEGRMAAAAEEQYVTDVSRGYALFLANCASCHGARRPGRRRAARSTTRPSSTTR